MNVTTYNEEMLLNSSLVTSWNTIGNGVYRFELLLEQQWNYLYRFLRFKSLFLDIFGSDRFIDSRSNFFDEA